METVILTIEVTGELDRELGDIAADQMVTKEDIARGIIAVHLADAREPSQGFGMDIVAEIFSGIGSALKLAEHKKAAQKNMNRIVRQQPVYEQKTDG